MGVYRSKHARHPTVLKAMLRGFVFIVIGATCAVLGFLEAIIG